MTDEKVITINNRIPKLKEQRKQRANKRLIFFLSLFFLLLLLVLYFQSPLSHIKKIVVTGNYFVEEEAIIRASTIELDTSIWNINMDEIAEQVQAIKEISTVEVKRNLPNQIDIFVHEHYRIAYLYSDGKYYPILENGQFLDELPRDTIPADAPILKDWEQGSAIEELASELVKVPNSILNRISEIYLQPTESSPLQITLYMNDGYEVHTTVRDFSERIVSYPAIVNELDPDLKGIIHLRMTPYFEKFETEEDEESES